MRALRPPTWFPSIALPGFCLAIVLSFVLLAWLGVRNKCATFDEPLDSIGGWTVARYGDYRISPTDPPLPYRWSALFQPRSALKADFQSTAWREAARNLPSEHQFAVNTLFRTPGNDADAFLARSRATMLVLPVIASLVIGAWGFRIGGAACAAAAMTLFCLDPNILAHAPLVKNDLSMALAAVSLMAAVWAVGRRASPARVATLAILCGVILSVKFNGPLFGPIVVLALTVRAILPQPWIVLGRSLTRLRSKLVAVLTIAMGCAAVAYLVVWSVYGFRFNPSTDPAFHLETRQIVRMSVAIQLYDRDPTHLPTEAEVDVTRPNWLPRMVVFLEDHRLLPQAFTNGMVRIYLSELHRSTFLMGRYGNDGWFYYFPLAFVFKTPLATLIAIVLAPLVFLRKRGMTDRWAAACLAIPIIVYAATAMAGNLNLGIRHLFPIYPFLFLSLGVAFAGYWNMNRRAAMGVGSVLLLALAAETLWAFPNFIPFFNAAAGGARGGVNLLSDSNIDWGQDLKQVAQWQQKHPRTPLYLCYFGTADPRYYGIHYTNMPGSYALGEDGSPAPAKMPPLAETGVIAISVTSLQATYSPQWRTAYEPLRGQEPIAVLGGSIYLYALGPQAPQE